MSDCPDYAAIRAWAGALKRPASSLLALSDGRDPFYLTPGRMAAARWFADVWRALSPEGVVHLRRLHYRYVSLPPGQRPAKLDGSEYQNTFNDWHFLTLASADARALGLVDAARFTDRRAGEPVFIADDEDEDGEATGTIYGVDLESPPTESALVFDYTPEVYEFPRLPFAYLGEPSLAEPYALEIWAEKSTMNDILAPMARGRNVTLVTGVGELSYTHCQWHVDRVLEHRKAARILYISDFDPAGANMPVSVARKIEFLLRRDEHDLDIRLEPLVLTAEQVRRYRLPRIPIKGTDKGKDRFEQQHGEGAVELDALEAVCPGELRRIVAAAVDRYRAPTRAAARENSAIAEEARLQIRAAVDEVLAEFVDEIRATREAFEAMRTEIEIDQQALAAIAAEATERSRAHVDAINVRVAAFHERAAGLWRRIGAELESHLPDADEFDWSTPEPADKDDDPLFDSQRDYFEQIDRYREHQGKDDGGGP
jgi:hypothetical protein